MDDYEVMEETEVEDYYDNVEVEEMESDEEDDNIGEEEVEETRVEVIYIRPEESDEEEGNIGDDEEEVEETGVEVIYIRQEESDEEVEETEVKVIYIRPEDTNNEEEEEAMWWRRVAMSDQPVRIRTVMKMSPFVLDTIKEEEEPQEVEEELQEEEEVPHEVEEELQVEEEGPQEEVEELIVEVKEENGNTRRPLEQEVMEARASEESLQPRRRWWRPKCLQRSSRKSRGSSGGERKPSRFLRFRLCCCISINTVE
ncbi:uncharacterized protein [Engystomops pustulosus]|uniref:uncharacterized protein n=1 Tax=Engystomops pustulosus TaxID=76066 RepID=UPI003AFA2F40